MELAKRVDGILTHAPMEKPPAIEGNEKAGSMLPSMGIVRLEPIGAASTAVRFDQFDILSEVLSGTASQFIKSIRSGIVGIRGEGGPVFGLIFLDKFGVVNFKNNWRLSSRSNSDWNLKPISFITEEKYIKIQGPVPKNGMDNMCVNNSCGFNHRAVFSRTS
uniref:Spore germination protein n=1 Tax=Rodentolepis nana TaxID=102285 RepID=A0A0R3THN6_RODNA